MWQQAREKDVAEDSKGKDPRGCRVIPDAEQGNPICYVSSTISIISEPY